MKQITHIEMLTRMDASVHDAIADAIKKTGATYLVLAEVLAMDSSSFGERTIMCAGPTCTYKSPQECEGKWLRDLPSQRMYFTEYCELPSD